MQILLIKSDLTFSDINDSDFLFNFCVEKNSKFIFSDQSNERSQKLVSFERKYFVHTLLFCIHLYK